MPNLDMTVQLSLFADASDTAAAIEEAKPNLPEPAPEPEAVAEKEPNGGFWDGAEVISVYTRAQAIADGVLVPTTSLVRDEDLAAQAGFKVPVALTQALAALVEPNAAERKRCQDLKGRLWDLLHMAIIAARQASDGSTVIFKCIFDVAGRDEYRYSLSERRFTGKKTVTLKLVLHGGDQGEPVMTLSFPHED